MHRGAYTFLIILRCYTLFYILYYCADNLQEFTIPYHLH